ncbi:hypothetical protein A2526_05050 [candidate division WOR-1 bacterium RIFOXYD2_FULL_36_8]|uniref:Uncharacterized protein n=1 Tax=candidate division WOR-1 bacterium RIFOXYB2_FULL_36_35 TaxID=1802578 RepID=A0A1F4S4W8_UNCSA|nr:MAG: hypothetical protein A2230_05325 [candidate division WOR-1 bacterium RIFOXYA2_FULL_36_21]OGC14502.1 MAG: hypothetical protein A2282_09385 [candidate division WOR-1 bacterium RIFOXYA12_FULL_36_13]OGC15481.1 MAG: hypothetical protein A2290_03720 [candidate division WOR-1 bacterium RIFOXYB2_FULL_36_35]OGC38288.1 MAG: hypothetical protein A2526_05050 [candidate division WOR-1 bacterium RIFOXYD2_FULL_36_8]
MRLNSNSIFDFKFNWYPYMPCAENATADTKKSEPEKNKSTGDSGVQPTEIEYSCDQEPTGLKRAECKVWQKAGEWLLGKDFSKKLGEAFEVGSHE